MQKEESQAGDFISAASSLNGPLSSSKDDSMLCVHAVFPTTALYIFLQLQSFFHLLLYDIAANSCKSFSNTFGVYWIQRDIRIR